MGGLKFEENTVKFYKTISFSRYFSLWAMYLFPIISIGIGAIAYYTICPIMGVLTFVVVKSLFFYWFNENSKKTAFTLTGEKCTTKLLKNCDMYDYIRINDLKTHLTEQGTFSVPSIDRLLREITLRSLSRYKVLSIVLALGVISFIIQQLLLEKITNQLILTLAVILGVVVVLHFLEEFIYSIRNDKENRKVQLRKDLSYLLEDLQLDGG